MYQKKLERDIRCPFINVNIGMYKNDHLKMYKLNI